MPRHGLPLLLLALVALSFNALLANAQFGNMFQNMFGQEQAQQQQQHFQNHHGASVRGWQIQDEGGFAFKKECARFRFLNSLWSSFSSMLQRLCLPRHRKLRQGPRRVPLSSSVSASS